MREPNRRVRWGQLRAGSGTPYQLTGDDVLWAARIALHEGGDAAATLWTLSQRYAGAARRTYPTFAAFVQTFSQPINPRYAPGGSYCVPGGRAYGTYWCSDALLARRAEARSASWSQLASRNPEDIQTVIAWANGQLPNPVPRAVNFAAPNVVRQNFPEAQIVLERGNVYIAEPWSTRWPRDYVTISGRSPTNAALAAVWDAVIYPFRTLPRRT